MLLLIYPLENYPSNAEMEKGGKLIKKKRDG
jgi:hypothetical protein